MTELSGTLDGVGLPAIVRFLGGLKKSGSLRLSQQEWRAEIFFDAGEVIEASFGSRNGIAALDAAIETLPRASFEFDPQARPIGDPSIRLSREALQMHLNELTARAARGERSLPLPNAVPQQIVDGSFEDGDEPLPLDRGTLQTLVSVDGRRTVREIVAQRETFEALWQLGYLIEVGVIGLPAGSAAEPSSGFRPAAAPPPSLLTALPSPPPEPATAPPVSPYSVTLPPITSRVPTPIAAPQPTPLVGPPTPVAGAAAPTP